jgi:hypothetical protein
MSSGAFVAFALGLEQVLGPSFSATRTAIRCVGMGHEKPFEQACCMHVQRCLQPNAEREVVTDLSHNLMSAYYQTSGKHQAAIYFVLMHDACPHKLSVSAPLALL